MTGYIHSIETLALADGPGIRTVVFMQGCPLRCIYCHNPDTWGRAQGTGHRAQGTGHRAQGTVHSAQVNDKSNQSFSLLTSHFSLKLTPAALLKKVLRYKEYYGETGGVTLSGGEPLLQAGFCAEFFALCKRHGIHTALDTSGFFNGQWIMDNGQLKDKSNQSLSIINYPLSIIQNTDLVILDIKHTDPEEYEKLTGRRAHAAECECCAVPTVMAEVLQFARLCADRKKRLWIRQVIIPGVNDTEAQVKKLAALARKFNAEKVELLPYHTMGAEKWRKLGRRYPLENVPPATQEFTARLQKIIDSEQ